MVEYKYEDGKYYKKVIEYYHGITGLCIKYIWVEIPSKDFPESYFVFANKNGG